MDTSDKQSRRSFVHMLSLGALTAMLATLATATARFLHPLSNSTGASWLDVGPIAEIGGNNPVGRKISTDHFMGWATSREEHLVYILPHQNNQILSAVCPHEGCEVSWDRDQSIFACPCHESNFNSDGQRINGPAPRGLDLLPSRVENGRLQVQYQFFINNTQERKTRT